MDAIKLNKILNDHKKWLVGDYGSCANLAGANLVDANLAGANLADANLVDANFAGANLAGANLAGANLVDANLAGANLAGANLVDANLACANLAGANLIGAKLEFYKFPSIRLLSSIPLGELSDEITLELMRRDAYAHPKPDKFTIWAKDIGGCPYQNEERFWAFKEKKELWKPGNPQMRDSDLIVAICKEKGWKINQYLK